MIIKKEKFMPTTYEKVIQYLIAKDSHFLDEAKEGKKDEAIKKFNAGIAQSLVDVGLISKEQSSNLSVFDLRLLTSDTVWPLVTEKIIANEHIEEWGWDKFLNVMKLLNHPRVSPFILSGELTFSQIISLRDQVSNDEDLYKKAKVHLSDIITALNNPSARMLLINEFIRLADVIDLGASDIIKLAEALNPYEMRGAIDDVKSGRRTVAEKVFFESDLYDEDNDGIDNFVNGIICCWQFFCCCSRRSSTAHDDTTNEDKSVTNSR